MIGESRTEGAEAAKVDVPHSTTTLIWASMLVDVDDPRTDTEKTCVRNERHRLWHFVSLACIIVSLTLFSGIR